jgi:hypothetical protein
MLAQLLELRPTDRAVIDSALLEVLCQRMGARGAEAYVTEKVEEISDRLAEIDWIHRQSLPPRIQSEALRVARLSGDIGLVSLARVARDLALTAAQGDMAAYRAVWERLVRIGDRSLAQVWDAPGLSL